MNTGAGMPPRVRARASSSWSCPGARVDFRVTGASSSSMSFMPHRISDMSLPLAGAQEPFWMRATLRPRRAWWARSRRKLSMETKMPLL